MNSFEDEINRDTRKYFGAGSVSDGKASVLVNGRIPANTLCPYREKCEIAKGGECNHQGVRHSMPFSCAAARSFEIMSR